MPERSEVLIMVGGILFLPAVVVATNRILYWLHLIDIQNTP